MDDLTRARAAPATVRAPDCLFGDLTPMATKPRTHRIALSYVNPHLEFHADGRVGASMCFHDRKSPWVQASVDQLWRGGVRLVVFSYGVNDADMLPGSAAVDFILRCTDALVSEIEAHPRCALIRTKTDLRRAEREGQLGVVLHLTGCPINGSLQVLRSYASLGVRSMHPVIRSDEIGGEWKDDTGLTRLGKSVVEEMQSLNMLVDTAHTNDRAFRQIVKMTDGPFMDSHTGCRAIIDKMRNRADRDLKTIGERQGVVGVHFDSKLIAPVVDQYRNKQIEKMQPVIERMRKRHADNPYAFLAERYDPQRWPLVLGGGRDDGHEPVRAPLDDLIDHLDRMVRFAGEDHVGIGTDYALGSICAGVESADRLPNMVKRMRQRGYSEANLKKILYQNVRRVLLATLPSA